MFPSLKASFFSPFPFPKSQASEGKYYGPLPADVESLGNLNGATNGRVIEEPFASRRRVDLENMS